MSRRNRAARAPRVDCTHGRHDDQGVPFCRFCGRPNPRCIVCGRHVTPARSGTVARCAKGHEARVYDDGTVIVTRLAPRL